MVAPAGAPGAAAGEGGGEGGGCAVGGPGGAEKSPATGPGGPQGGASSARSVRGHGERTQQLVVVVRGENVEVQVGNLAVEVGGKELEHGLVLRVEFRGHNHAVELQQAAEQGDKAVEATA